MVEAAIDDFKLEAISFNEYLLGDINGDLFVNILDVILLVNMALGSDPPNLSTGDINFDSEINILDVVNLVSMILDN